MHYWGLNSTWPVFVHSAKDPPLTGARNILGLCHLWDRSFVSYPLSLGIASASRMLGPTLGYILGSACLAIYVDPGTQTILFRLSKGNPARPRLRSCICHYLSWTVGGGGCFRRSYDNLLHVLRKTTSHFKCLVYYNFFSNFKRLFFISFANWSALNTFR